MTGGPHTIPVLPAYIPPGVDLNAIKADVGRDGVSAPANEVEGLVGVVADAHHKGIDLKIVVVEKDPPIDTPLRDIATEVGHVYPDSTVLVMSPIWAGTYSRAFDRVTLEAGQDVAKTGNPVESATNFVHELTKPEFPWTAMTIVVTIGVVAAVVATRALQVWAKRGGRAEGQGEAASGADR